MVSRREIERKRKDEMETAHVFEEFIETFQVPENKSVSKVWVKAGVFKPDEAAIPEPSSTSSDDKVTLYKPLPRFKSRDKCSVEHAQECARILTNERKYENVRRKKSNLESFKEELELMHRDREERQKYKEEIKSQVKTDTDSIFYGLDQGDPSSTNLYVNNLNPKMTESQLMQLFGTYGPLASVKIMWPRSEEEKSRNRNCGFVAYMSRRDAERGLKHVSGKVVMDCELKVGWGRAVVIPPHPVYIPQVLLELSQPPPPSGLPFNAQPPKYVPRSVDSMEDFLKLCVVKVVIPTDRYLVALIHRTIEFVVREGLLFEALMMTREINNPSFRFLFDNQCPEHVYYRWKLFSILQGDSIREWRTQEFRMFADGPVWKPPLMQTYLHGMSDSLIDYEEKTLAALKKSLSTTQRDNLESLIHKIGPERSKILEALVFCVEHSDAAAEIVQCIAQSLETKTSRIKKIVGRLYLVSDILYNCKIHPGLAGFLKNFEACLSEVMEHMCCVYELLENYDKQIFFVKVTRIFNAWIQWNIYPSSFTEHLYKIFTKSHSTPEEPEISTPSEVTSPALTSAGCQQPSEEEEESKILPGFIPSRWETVDPEIIESQAMTSTKWFEEIQLHTSGDNSQIEESSKTSSSFQGEQTRSKTMSEEQRKKLRDIEVKVMEYQDALESGEEELKPSNTMAQQVKEFRKKLIKQYEEKQMHAEKKSSKKRRSRSGSPKKSSKSTTRKSAK